MIWININCISLYYPEAANYSRSGESNLSRRWPSYVYWYVTVGTKTKNCCCGHRKDRDLDRHRTFAEDGPPGTKSPRPSRQYAKELVRGIKGRRLVEVALTLLFIKKTRLSLIVYCGLHWPYFVIQN